MKKSKKKPCSEYIVWIGMKQRCYYPKSISFKNYGGRGIVVCDRWRTSFKNFLDDMGMRPSKLHTLDRFPNPDGDYEPKNCRWATKSEQALGRRTCHKITLDGETLTITEWALKTGIPRNAIYLRINHLGWPARKALSKPSKRPAKS